MSILLVVTVAVGIAVSGAAQADEVGDVPLWQLKPFDRVTLSNNATHDIDPQRIPPGVEFDGEEGEYVGRPGLPPVREIRRIARYRLRLQENGLEYYVLGRHVERIDYYEDLLLEEARRLTRDGRFDAALPYLERLHEIDPDWPGLLDAIVEYHREEGNRYLFSGDFESAFWAYVEAMRQRESGSTGPTTAPPLEMEIERTAERWLNERWAAQDYAEVRRIVRRLESVPAGDELAERWRKDIAARCSALLAEAQDLQSQNDPKEAVVRLEEAVSIDPTNAEIRAAIEQAYQSHGHLRVAVEQVAAMGGPLPQTEADRRAFELVHLRLVQPVFGSEPPRWESKILASVQRPDQYVNKRAVLEIRSGLVWPSGDKSVSVADLQRVLVDACRPASPTFHPAFARLVTQIQPELPVRVAIDFDRPQPRPEAWLELPMVRRISGSEAKWVGLGPFAIHSEDRDRADFLANPHFVVADSPRIKRVTEIPMDDAAKRLRALQNREVDLVTNLLPRQAAVASHISGARVVTLAVPVVHVLEFNWNQRVLRDRTLRRAIAFAIDRSTILDKLGIDSGRVEALPTAPWPIGTFGYEDKIQSRDFDPVLAKTLVAAVRRKYGSLPVLRLLHGGTEADRIVCDEILRYLTMAGLEIRNVAIDPASPISPLTADIYYTGLRVTEPVQDMITILTRDNPTLWDHASPWLRQAVVHLVEVPTITEARERMPRLHRVLHDDVAILPIWQEAEQIAVSDRIHDFPGRPTSTYDSVFEWQIRPGFPPAYWDRAAADREPNQP